MPPRIPPNISTATGTATGTARTRDIDPSKFFVDPPDYWPGELIVKVAPDGIRELTPANPCVLPDSVVQMLVWLLDNYGLRRVTTLWYSGAPLARTAGVPPASLPPNLQKLGDRITTSAPLPGTPFPSDLVRESLSLLHILLDPDKPMTAETLHTLAATPSVVYAEQIPLRFQPAVAATRDQPPFQTDPGAKTADPQLAIWGANQVIRPATWDFATPDNIAVLDSGCDGGHPAFGIRFSGLTDVSGHGTMVCGVIAACAAPAPAGKSATIWDVPTGLLPKTKVQVLNIINGDPNSRQPVDGELSWVIHPRLYSDALAKARKLSGIRVVNISNGYGAKQYQTEKDDFQSLETAGISVVASCGNVPKSMSAATILYPAIYDTVISVGALAYDPTLKLTNPALWARTRWNLPSGVQRTNATGVDVIAPGERILSPRLRSDADLPFSAWNTGTSLAAPFVTAVVAMMYKANPSLTPQNIRDAIKTKLTPRTIGGRSVRLLDCSKLV